MKTNTLLVPAFLCLCLSRLACAQDPVGSIEGHVVDHSAAPVAAHVVAKNLATGLVKETTAAANGLFRIPLLPVGQYSITVDAAHFATLVQEPLTIDVSETVRVDYQLQVATVKSVITVNSDATLVEASSNTLGAVVSGREILDLPLNGRNFTQLGLLQAGVAPLTNGLLEAGGPLRQGQTYSVNGGRPEQNMYTIDGAQNVNRMDGGYALKIPVDAIAEFRILTQTAEAQYGGTGGATTAVVTRAGSNQFHGSLYEFVRNDKMDTRNFFSPTVLPLKQNQFGGTGGGAIKKDRLFYFVYYEGYRNRDGQTTSAIVPSAAERPAIFQALVDPC